MPDSHHLNELLQSHGWLGLHFPRRWRGLEATRSESLLGHRQHAAIQTDEHWWEPCCSRIPPMAAEQGIVTRFWGLVANGIWILASEAVGCCTLSSNSGSSSGSCVIVVEVLSRPPISRIGTRLRSLAAIEYCIIAR